MGKWIETCQTFSRDVHLSELCGCTYWKMLFEACVPDAELDRQFNVPCTHAFLLHGSAGNGKLTLALALAGELRQAGFIFLHIPVSVLAGENEEEAVANIDSLFRELTEGDKLLDRAGFCMLLEDMKQIVSYDRALQLLMRKIQELKARKVSCVILATAEEITDYPTCLVNVIIPCAIGLPTEQERRQYLEDKLEGQIALEQRINFKKMAQMTEGFNYGCLHKAVMLIGMLMKQKMKKICGNDAERRKAALEQGGVRLTEEMFREIIVHLIGRKTDITPSCGKPDAGNDINVQAAGADTSSVVSETKEKESFKDVMESLDLDNL